MKGFDFSPKTVKDTRGFIDRNLLPALGSVPLSKLKASDLDRFYRKLSVNGGARSGPVRLAPSDGFTASCATPWARD